MIQATFNGKKMKTLRIERKLTQERLAEKADLSVRQLGMVENGKSKNPHASTVCRISRALNVPMDTLMTVTMEEDEDSSVN